MLFNVYTWFCSVVLYVLLFWRSSSIQEKADCFVYCILTCISVSWFGCGLVTLYHGAIAWSVFYDCGTT